MMNAPLWATRAIQAYPDLNSTVVRADTVKQFSAAPLARRYHFPLSSRRI
uniref:Uncharacterized protein n=1 Tax=Burkholderia sp. (strain CCGE1003) TaxID=640512 RepID=E1TD51_BURSG